MASTGDAKELTRLPTDELERRVALLYEAGLIDLQKRMHPEASRPPTHGDHIRIAGASLAPPTPGAGESAGALAAHGRQIFESMIEPALPKLCESFASRPGSFQSATGGVQEITRHLTRVDPPDPLFVTAAALLWKEGLERRCAGVTHSL